MLSARLSLQTMPSRKRCKGSSQVTSSFGLPLEKRRSSLQRSTSTWMHFIQRPHNSTNVSLMLGFDDELETEGADAFAELKAFVVARSEYVVAQSKQYAEGKLSLPMLAYMTGTDVIEAMLGLSEVGMPSRVTTGLEQERLAAFEAIGANKAAGCVVDAATYHCIRRLLLEDAVVTVCGKIGIAQATADLYQARLQNLALEKGRSGSMTYCDGKFCLVERTEELKERIRTTISSDIDWLINNADIVPARPVKDPPVIFRRLIRRKKRTSSMKSTQPMGPIASYSLTISSRGRLQVCWERPLHPFSQC